jgi:uncharacterized protein YdbL (DUF1318 family)
MKTITLLLVSCMAAAGCAKVQVQAPKEPIKVDISMRLDVYQHVEKDIDAIENIVSGAPEEPQSKLQNFLFAFIVPEAHAGDLSPEVEQAALRRRDRRDALMHWQQQGVIGENNAGLVEVRDASKADASVEALVSAENSDRMVIYKGVAEKNGTSVGEVQNIYAQRLQEDAPVGTPLQDPGSGSWKIK